MKSSEKRTNLVDSMAIFIDKRKRSLSLCLSQRENIYWSFKIVSHEKLFGRPYVNEEDEKLRKKSLRVPVRERTKNQQHVLLRI